VLGLLFPRALCAVAVLVVVRDATADGNLADRVVVGGLSVRGVNRALHAGDFDAARFPARVMAVICVPVALFLLCYVRSDVAEFTRPGPGRPTRLSAAPGRWSRRVDRGAG
jgi:hypothetical protein